MKKIFNHRITLILIAAFLLLIFPVFVQVYRIYVSNLDSLSSQADKTEFFLSHFPEFLQNNMLILLISFLSCMISFIISAQSLKKLLNKPKGLAYINIALSAVTGFLNLFQMI